MACAHSTSSASSTSQVPGVALGTLARDVPPVSLSTCNVGPFGLLKLGKPNAAAERVGVREDRRVVVSVDDGNRLARARAF